MGTDCNFFDGKTFLSLDRFYYFNPARSLQKFNKKEILKLLDENLSKKSDGDTDEYIQVRNYWLGVVREFVIKSDSDEFAFIADYDDEDIDIIFKFKENVLGKDFIGKPCAHERHYENPSIWIPFQNEEAQVIEEI